MLQNLKNAKKVIGIKQVTKAVEKGLANRVWVADDAEERLVEPLKTLCKSKGVALEAGMTMAELGKACAIEVGAAAVAVVAEG
ncbi:MAG: ribosomal L7Ae/L30e/S12e/Gadd45 family protein [Sporomusaceae bacterium]|nr:ribosomal L7Ae/L30e/S12e/Gadd45 family protein [Sporomusaceae bacterium]